MPSSRGIHMRGDRIKTRRGEISRAAPGKPALREAAARPGSSHGNSAHPLLSHSSTRNPSSPSHRGALPPISACGSFQRRRTSSACGNEKPAPKARTGRDPCCQLDGRGSLNLRSGRNYIILNLPLSSLQLELYQVNLKQGTKREGDGEREREGERETPHLHVPHLPSSEERRQAACCGSTRGAELRSHPGRGHLRGHRHLRRCRRRGQRSRVRRRFVEVHACHVVISVRSSGDEFTGSSSACVPRCLARTFRSESSSTCGFGPMHCSATTCW